MAIEVFKSTTQLKEGMQVECEARGHKFLLDEPKELGGTDTGMNPVEALLSSLGACKCIVARCFARLHKIDLKDIRIELEGDLDPDGFMGKNKDAKIGFTTIRTKIYIESDSPKEKLQEFVDFIDRTCPVADTLHNSPKLETELIVK
jgi:uncharacterized OsmC-like protein